jgi:hypothetical protein
MGKSGDAGLTFSSSEVPERKMNLLVGGVTGSVEARVALDVVDAVWDGWGAAKRDSITCTVFRAWSCLDRREVAAEILKLAFRDSTCCGLIRCE